MGMVVAVVLVTSTPGSVVRSRPQEYLLAGTHLPRASEKMVDCGQGSCTAVSVPMLFSMHNRYDSQADASGSVYRPRAGHMNGADTVLGPSMETVVSSVGSGDVGVTGSDVSGEAVSTVDSWVLDAPGVVSAETELSVGASVVGVKTSVVPSTSVAVAALVASEEVAASVVRADVSVTMVSMVSSSVVLVIDVTTVQQ
uniref:Uncharacterized protein n=1 Tax=Anopheles atroparvus TaxID=41427 RepID=A0A182IX26_ANOAO